MANLSISATSVAPVYSSVKRPPAENNLKEVEAPIEGHVATFIPADQFVAHEKSTYAAHGIKVSDEYVHYLIYSGSGETLSPKEWEAQNSSKRADSKQSNILINSLSSSTSFSNKEDPFKSTPASISKSKLEEIETTIEGHVAIFYPPDQAIAHEKATFAAHGISVSDEYIHYLFYEGLDNPVNGAVLRPEEWEAQKKSKSTPPQDTNLLINSLSSSAAFLNKDDPFKSTPASILKSKLDIFYTHFD
jgi:hypothetical protein